MISTTMISLLLTLLFSSTQAFNNQSLFIKDSLLFELKNRPLISNQITTLQQSYSIHGLFQSLEQHQQLGHLLNETCIMIPNHYTVSQGERLKELRLVHDTGSKIYNPYKQNPDALPPYHMVRKIPETEYMAKYLCQQAGMKMPEPKNAEEVQLLAYFLKQNDVMDTFIGVTFDIKTMRNVLTTTGIPIEAKLYNGMPKEKIISPRGDIIKLDYTVDDFGAKFTVTDTGYIKYWGTPENLTTMDMNLHLTLTSDEHTVYTHLGVNDARRISVWCL